MGLDQDFDWSNCDEGIARFDVSEELEDNCEPKYEREIIG